LGFAKKDDPIFAEVNLKELVDEAVHLVNREAANKDVEIVRQMDPDKSIVWSDPYLLRQVFINLLTNGIYATGAGGTITILLEGVDGEINLTVRDSGRGIPKENLNKIFEPFFTTKPPGEGTGLGLFVTRGIIEKLGGTIKVESRLGQGTSFYIRLPKYRKIKENQDQDERIRFLDDLADQSKSTP
jgi:signal transduction histidine kinase